MSSIFVGQNWTLTLDCSTDVSAASTKQLRLKYPNGDTLNLDASVVGTDNLRASLTAAQTNQPGTYKFQTYAVIAGATYFGETFEQEVKSIFN